MTFQLIPGIYGIELDRSPTPEGKLDVKWEFDNLGNIQAINIEEISIEEKIALWVFFLPQDFCKPHT